MKRYSLPKRERIKSTVIIQLLLKTGKRLYSPDKRIRAIVLPIPADDEKTAFRISPEVFVQAAFIVPKKSGKAFWRNRIRRLLREAYRRNKYLLIDRYKERNMRMFFTLHSGMLTQAVHGLLSLAEVEPAVISLMKQAIRHYA